MIIGAVHIWGACGYALGVISAVVCMLIGVWVDEQRGHKDERWEENTHEETDI